MILLKLLKYVYEKCYISLLKLLKYVFAMMLDLIVIELSKYISAIGYYIQLIKPGRIVNNIRERPG